MKKAFLYLSFFLSGAFFFTSCLDLDLADGLDCPPGHSSVDPWYSILGRNGDTLRVQWKVRHNREHPSNSFGIIPILHENMLYVSSEHYTSKEYLYGIDLNEREIVWEWSDFEGAAWGEKPEVLHVNRYHDLSLLSGRIMWATKKGTYAIDANTGQLLNTRHIDQGRYYRLESSSVQHNVLLQSLGWGMQQEKIEICDAALNCQTVYDVVAPEGYVNGFSQPILVVDEATAEVSDSLLIFGRQLMNCSRNLRSEEIKLIAYNLSRNEVQWEFNVPVDLDGKRIRLQTLYPPLIADGYIYFQLASHFFCIDLATGKEVWAFNHSIGGSGGGSTTKILFDENRLYFTNSGARMTCLDAKTGTQYWSNDESFEVGGSGGTFVKFKDRLFNTSGGRINVIDANTGRGLKSFVSPNAIDHDGVHIKYFTIDEERDVMYVDDGYYILACEIPGMW